MSLKELAIFLEKTPIGVSFGFLKLGKPTFSWPKTNYKDSLTLQELQKIIFKKYEIETGDKTLYKKLSSQYSIKQLEKIQQAQNLIKTIKSIKSTTEDILKKKSTAISKILTPINYFQSGNDVDDLKTLTEFQIKIEDDKNYFEKLHLRLNEKEEEELKEQEELAKQFFNFSPFFQNFRGSTNNNARTFTWSSQHPHNIPPLFKQFFYSTNGSTYSQPNQTAEPTPSFDPYKILGVSPQASKSEIRKKYHKLALKMHPDKNIKDPKAKEKFQQLQKAYDLLK